MKEIKSKVSFLPSLQLNGLLFTDDFVGLSDSKQCCSYIIIARSGGLKQMLQNVR